jgi:predicted RNA-binding protein with PUA-like domain
MACWLVKTEPEVFSIDDFARAKVTDWTGVRNYQARNFLRSMKVKDKVLVYHSNAQPSAVVGLASVLREAQPDRTQFDCKSEYFDPKSTLEKPRWFCPDLSFVRKLKTPIALDVLRGVKSLSGLLLLERGSRLSVIPVSDKHFDTIVDLAA